MKVRVFFLLSILLHPSDALATAVISCKAVDGRSGAVNMSVGRLPILNVLSAEVSAFGKTWSTNKDAKNPIVVGQAFENESQLFVDFTDQNIEKILISLRTLKSNTKKEYAEAGVLRIGEAVYPVVCESR